MDKIQTERKEILHWFLFAFSLVLLALFVKFSFNVIYDVEDKSWFQRLDDHLVSAVADFRFGKLNNIMVEITALGSGTLIILLSSMFFLGFLFTRSWLGLLQLTIAVACAE